MEIDAVKEGTRDPLAVALHLITRTTTLALRIAVLAAGAGVHGSHEHEG